MLIKRVVCLIIVLMIATTVSHAGEKLVRVATLEDYAPFCMVAKGAIVDRHAIPPGTNIPDFSGYCWDVLRESFHEMGYSIQLSVTPWPRAMLNVKSGKVDILFPAGKNSTRLKIFNYSQEPTNVANFLIYVRADSPYEWKGLDGLKGMTIGLKRGFNYGDKWEAAAPGIIKHKIQAVAQGFTLLSANRIDGFLGYEYNWDYYLKQANLTHQFKKLPPFDATAEYLVALKTNPKGELYLNIFDSGKRHLIQTGRLAEINKKWFGHP